MIQDCRAGKPAGWSFFTKSYTWVIRALLAHYFPERGRDAQLIDRVLETLRAELFQTLEPAPERVFVAELRQHVLAAVEADRAGDIPEIELDLDAMTQALAPLTAVEKQAVWFETMRYDAAAAGRMLRADPKTIQKNRERAAELIRGAVDSWRRTLVAENGPQLGRTAAAQAGKECPGPKPFFNMLDGRITWRDREELERHVAACWHCVDHFCRLREAADLLRGGAPAAR